MKKILTIIFAGLCMYIFCVCSYAQRISTELENSVFRIHIVANSNSNQDQEIKLKVRDNIVKYFENENLHFESMNDTIKYFQNNIECLNNIVLETLNRNNIDYRFNTNISNQFFPTKRYSNISLPSGKYNCIKIVLGNGNGANWWCMLYPNLCINDLAISSNSSNILKDTISNDAYLMITNEKKYSFKIIEIYENVKHKFQ